MAASIEVAHVFNRKMSGELILDVRTPAEYAQGHIPGAANLPLFSNAERAEVGTIYRTINPEQAMQRGLEIVGPKLAQLVRSAQSISRGKKITVHCWRGGQRSGSVAWLLETAGLTVEVLQGGYKAYRAFQRQWLENTPCKFAMVSGYTGSGKTDLLKALKDLGEQVLDLEALANHKGSAFGWIGECVQPTTEQFENEVIATLKMFNPDRRIWIESESRRIGKIFLPDALWNQMLTAQIFRIDVPLEERVERLVSAYAHTGNDEELVASFGKIRDRMGFQNYKHAITALQKHQYAEAAQIALAYYDQTYRHSLSMYPAAKVQQIHFTSQDSIQSRAEQLIAFTNQLQDNVLHSIPWK